MADRLRRAAAILPLLLCAPAMAQEPEHLGDTHVRAAMVLMQPNASEAAIYLDKGFGVHPIALVATINWRLTVGQEPYKYALFRIRDGGVPTDDYWVTERATWTAYLTHRNAATLKAASWQFDHFTLNSEYDVPTLPFPVVWETRTPELTIGYSRGCTLPVVRSADGLSWEWTIRGPKAINTWEFASSREDAMLAAEEAIGDL